MARSVSGVGRLHYTIPEDLHRAIKAKAATQGIFLKDFVIAALWAALDAPAPEPAEKSVPSTRKRAPAAKAAPKAAASAKTTNKPRATVRKKAPPAG